MFIAIAITIYFVVSAYKIYNNSFKVRDQTYEPDVINITAENYTNILKAVHDDIDSYIGKKVCFTGYIYRIDSFAENRFILARDMKLTENQSVIVGFLSESDKLNEYHDYDWIDIEATIEKTNYNNQEVPLLKITSITKTTEPKNSAVPKPDDDFVETAVIY